MIGTCIPLILGNTLQIINKLLCKYCSKKKSTKPKVDLLKKEIKRRDSNASFCQNMKLQDTIEMLKSIPFLEADAACTKKYAENFRSSLHAA